MIEITLFEADFADYPKVDVHCVATIPGSRRRGLADGEQRVALCPIRTELESARCSEYVGTRYRVNYCRCYL